MPALSQFHAKSSPVPGLPLTTPENGPGFQAGKERIERFSIAFTANGKRQAEISRLPKTREINFIWFQLMFYLLVTAMEQVQNREIS